MGTEANESSQLFSGCSQRSLVLVNSVYSESLSSLTGKIIVSEYMMIYII